MLALHERRRIEMDLPCVRLPRSSEPPSGTEKTDESRHADGVVHIARLDGLHGGEEEHHTDEDDPRHCNGVDWFAPSAHRVWSGMEDHLSLIPSMRNDDGNVTDVQGRGSDVENCRDG